MALAGVALAGCGQNNQSELANETAVPENEQAVDADAAEPAAEPEAEEEAPDGADPGNGEAAGSTLPPAGAGLRFVGLWASEAANCEGRAWRFTAERLQTPAGSVCNFERVTPVSGGYDIAATCTAEGPPSEDTLEIRFAESAKAMLFESTSIADAGLVYCGRGS